MVELYCMMCGHVWYDPKVDACPECKCRDFIVNDDSGFSEDRDKDWEDGHYEGDFPQSISNDHGHGD